MIRTPRLAPAAVRALPLLLLLAAPLKAQHGSVLGGDTGSASPLPPASTSGLPGVPKAMDESHERVLQPIPMNVLAVPFPIAGGIDDQIGLLVELDGKELLAGNDGAVDGEIAVSVVDDKGAVADQFKQPFVLDASDEQLARGLKLYGILRVQPGDYKVKIAVSDKAGAKGRAEAALHAPDFGRHEAALSPPLFPEPADRWRVFQQSDSPHDDLPFPFVDAQGGGFLPGAVPTIGPEGGTCVVYAYGNAGDAPRVSAKVTTHGKTLQPKVTLLEAGTGKFTIQRRLVLHIDGPLPEGGGRLELALQAPDAVRTTASALMVQAQAEAQPELHAQATDEPQNPADEPAALPAGFTREDVATRYREVLTHAAGGELDAAVRQLTELETAATPHHRPGELKALREVERSTIEAQHTGLVSAAYLHVRLDDELSRRGDAWMVAQNRIWLNELMERWVKSGQPNGRHLAAQLLAAVGSNQEALGYEATNELALLRLAISAEKTGDLDGAAGYLHRLLTAHPDNVHARLRLAIVNRRRHDEVTAGHQLAELMSDAAAPKWIASLACQQLAEIERARGNEPQAETVLRQGIDKLATQALYLQLAFYLDERQKTDEAVQVLNGMPVIAGPEQLSGRFLYNEPPRAEVALARQQVEAAVMGEWPQLRAGLQAHVTPTGSRH